MGERNDFERLQHQAAPDGAGSAELRPFGASADPSKKYATPAEIGRLQREPLPGRLRAGILDGRRVLIIPLQTKGGRRG
jgi:hypothetical protein